MAAKKAPEFFGYPPPQREPFTCASVYFETNKAELGSAERNTLSQVADVLVVMAAWKEEVAGSCIGYTDIRGTYVHNVDLSAARATAVKLHLLTRATGIRVDIKTRPLATLHAHANRNLYPDDRRVDVEIATPIASDGIGFEFDDSAAAGVFVKNLERLEVVNGGTVMAWMQDELLAIKAEHELGARYGWERAEEVSFIIDRMGADEFVALSRRHVAACARVEDKQLPDGRHQVTVRITDSQTSALLLPEVTSTGAIDKDREVSRDLYWKLSAGYKNISQRLAAL